MKQSKKKISMGHMICVIVPKCIKASPTLWLAMICTDICYSLVTVLIVRLLQGFFDNVAGALNGKVAINTVIISMLLLAFLKLLDQVLNAMSNMVPGIYWQKANGILIQGHFNEEGISQ